jgi:outer membrane protein insertion porin family
MLRAIVAISCLTAGCAHLRDDGVQLNYDLSADLPPSQSVAKQPSTADTSADLAATAAPRTVQRGQSVSGRESAWANETTAGSDDTFRQPMSVSGIPTEVPAGTDAVQPAQFASPQSAAGLWGGAANPNTLPRTSAPAPAAVPNGASGNSAATNPWQPSVPKVAQLPNDPTLPIPGTYSSPTGSLPPPSAVLPPPPEVGLIPTPTMGLPTPYADVFVNVRETQTGRLMIGAAVNSDAGLTGQLVVDEKNFDWRRVPRSWDDVMSGSAFRGAGQGFRIEAMPGSQVQRYMINFTEPYLGGTRVSFNLSGYLFDRQYFDWDEQRLGGRVGLGYRITPDLSLAANLKAEEVTITEPRILGVPELDAALGQHELYSTRFSLTQDTRDIPFAPTQGYYLELAYEQTFGSFDYPRGSLDFRRYFLVAERPDGSGRHVLSFSNRLMVSGSETPVFENFFAGGYSTLRGFDFRGASPQSGGVVVGGEFAMLGSVEYLFPVTADDMLKGVVFCDYGTVEEEVQIESDDYRVALGAGLRISIPAMGPAPIALDFAVPVARENTDDIRAFSFFMGVGR